MLNSLPTSSVYFTSLLETISPARFSLPLSLPSPLVHLLDMDVYRVHDVDNVPDPPRGIGIGFSFAVSRGFALGGCRYNNSTQSHEIDTRYSLPHLPRVPDLLSRYGLLRPFSLLLPSYLLPQRATIYIIYLLLKACVPANRAARFDLRPPGHESCLRRFASSR